MSELLSMRGAARRVDDRLLWRDLGFTLAGGGRLVIDGPSGSGKTLLLRAIAALDPFEGECRFRGRTPQEWGVPQYRAQVMYLPQRAALPEGTVAAALAAPFVLGVHRNHSFDQRRARDLLTALGRPSSLWEADVDTLSGGERQSVLLCRALLLEPSVLLLDEITSALDEELAAAAESVLLSWAGNDRALIWVGHDGSARERVGTDVLRLADFATPDAA